MKKPARSVSRWVPVGGQTDAWARMVKKAANRELKNITSDPSQMMTPTASIEGLSGRWRVGLAMAGSAARAWVTEEVLLHRALGRPTRAIRSGAAVPGRPDGPQPGAARAAGGGVSETTVSRRVGRVSAT